MLGRARSWQKNVADRPGDVGRRERRGRDLVEQRLEAMMVLPVDHGTSTGARRSDFAASKSDVLHQPRRAALNANTLYQLQENVVIAALRRPTLGSTIKGAGVCEQHFPIELRPAFEIAMTNRSYAADHGWA